MNLYRDWLFNDNNFGPQTVTTGGEEIKGTIETDRKIAPAKRIVFAEVHARATGSSVTYVSDNVRLVVGAGEPIGPRVRLSATDPERAAA